MMHADHGIDDILQLNHYYTLNRNRDLLRKIASCYGVTDSGNILNLCLEEPKFLDGAHATLKGRRGKWPHRNNQGTGTRRAVVSFESCIVQHEGIRDRFSACRAVGMGGGRSRVIA